MTADGSAAVRISVHDALPAAEAAIVDTGIGDANDAAAPLHAVQPLSCFARDASGRVVGGAVGRRWGGCCELQQLWVEPSRRRQGIGAALLRAFERHAVGHGCTQLYLETFSFQAPSLYRALGYRVELERRGFPDGIVKLHMAKDIGAEGPGGSVDRSADAVAVRRR